MSLIIIWFIVKEKSEYRTLPSSVFAVLLQINFWGKVMQKKNPQFPVPGES